MRRTTICRSDQRAALLALVAGLLAVAGGAPRLAAQDTTEARSDTVPAVQDTSQAAAAVAPAVESGQLPATHPVVRGETLWSIALLYFGDPLLWPEIYRLNTAVIEDPHWIYPGEVLNLAPFASVAQAPADTAVAAGPELGADTVRAEAPADPEASPTGGPVAVPRAVAEVASQAVEATAAPLAPRARVEIALVDGEAPALRLRERPGPRPGHAVRRAVELGRARAGSPADRGDHVEGLAEGVELRQEGRLILRRRLEHGGQLGAVPPVDARRPPWALLDADP